MKTPRIPSEEPARLQALRACDILGSEDEPAFDAITKIAAHVLGTPIALVSLVDEHRQWFKSRVGLDVRELPRETSFCGHVVAEGTSMVVPDAAADERFADNPLVTDAPHIRFYVGVPLRTAEGLVLGTLCAIDRAPRSPTPEQLEVLRLLANQVVELIETRNRGRQLRLERERAEQAATRLEVLFAAMAEGVVVQAPGGEILLANAAAEQILGLTLEELSGRTSVDPRWNCVREDGSPFPGADHPAMVALRTGEPQRNVIMGVHKPTGEMTWISINALPQASGRPDGRPTSVVTTFHDISVIRAAQKAGERLARQERLVTTGTLAAGVGHEINNPLSFILSGVELALEEVRAIAGGSPSGRLRELVEVLGNVRDGAERIRRIVRGLRSLAREESDPVPTCVDDPLEVALNMSAHEIRHRARVVKSLASTPPVLADESRLAQLFVNLLVNAGQAMADGDPDRDVIDVSSSLAPDGRVCVAISDTGQGIPPELVKRIFDPFFTTKPVGQGTGLGLSISQSIVAALGGEITVDSVVGKGTTFRVLLPVAQQAVEPKAQTASVAPSARGYVLVVDDERAILGMFERALGKDHTVVAVDDPREALRLVRSGEDFDVVFCDLVMPHKRGDDLYREIARLRPAIADRFVFVTGGETLPELEAFLAGVPNERIEKPFNLQNVRGIVRRFASTAKG